MEKAKNSKKILIKDQKMAHFVQNFKTSVKMDVGQLQTSLNHELKSQKQAEREWENNKIKKNISLNIKIEPCIYKSESIMGEQQQSITALKNNMRTKFKPRYRTKNKVGELKQSKSNEKQIRFLSNHDQEKDEGEQKKAKKGLNQQSKIKDMFNNYRLNKLKYHFFSQLRKNSLFRSPVNFQPFDTNNRYIPNKQQLQGIQISRILLNFAYFISISHTLLASFFITLLLVFRELSTNEFIKYFQILTIVILGCQIFMGFIRIRSYEYKNLVKIRQICQSYLSYSFWIDLVCFLCGFLSYLVREPLLNYCFVVFFLKIPDCIEKLDKMETKIFDSFYWEQYWGLMKVLSTNFVYAHFIAILLLMMSWLDEDESWMIAKNILDSPWYEQYSWAYYWGTTIMLTVGFGDISAANYKEAICLVLIQTLSCMALAYNINEIGGLIKNLRSKQIQKQKSLKVLKKLRYKNQINSDLNLKLTTHVNQIYKIQTKYNFQEEEQFIQKLPINIKEQFYRTTNYKILQKITLIKNFTQRSLLELAQKLEVKIYRPDQVLYENVGFIDKVVILKQGQVGIFANFYSSKSQISNTQTSACTYKSTNNKHNKTIIDKYTIKEGEDACLISLDFLSHAHKYSHNNVKNYQIRSTGYSKMFEISIDDLVKILKKKDVDIQYYCVLKDEQKCNMDEFQLIKCTYCNDTQTYNNKKIITNKQLISKSDNQSIQTTIYHTKFKCPRLHYCPIAQQIIYKHLHKFKVQKNKRKQFDRKIRPRISLLKYKQVNDIMSTDAIDLNDCLLKQQDPINSTCECQECNVKLKGILIDDSKEKSYKNFPNQDNNSLSSAANYSSQLFLNWKQKRTIINRANLNILRRRKHTSHTSQNSHSANEIKTKLLKNATEIMQKQMEFLLKQTSQRQNQFWDIQVDQAKDFKFYFPKCNPKALESIRLKKYHSSSNTCVQKNISFSKSLSYFSKNTHKKSN